MIAQKLGEKLRAEYDAAPPKMKALTMHMFGIRYAQSLEGVSVSDVVEFSGLPNSYATEVRKGIRLSEYVVLK